MGSSARSTLKFGTAAIAATAVTVSGTAIAALDLPAVRVPTFANVELTVGYGNPLLEIFDTLEKANLYLFSIAEPPATGFDRAGIFPAFLAAGVPIATQYALNASDYVNQVGNYLFAEFDPVNDVLPGAARALTWAGMALPGNLGLAVQQVFSGNLAGALQTLQFAIVNPIQYAAYQVLNLGMYELGGVAARAAAVVTAVAEWVPTAIRSLADDVTVVLNAVGQNVNEAVVLLQNGLIQQSVQTLFHGFLGTNGNAEFQRQLPTVPDALINQTIGEGGFILKLSLIHI